MNRQQAAELAPIMQAFADGKEVQYVSTAKNKWADAHNPSFVTSVKYRIKPEPREFWICFDKGGSPIDSSALNYEVEQSPLPAGRRQIRVSEILD